MFQAQACRPAATASRSSLGVRPVGRQPGGWRRRGRGAWRDGGRPHGLQRSALGHAQLAEAAWRSRAAAPGSGVESVPAGWSLLSLLAGEPAGDGERGRSARIQRRAGGVELGRAEPATRRAGLAERADALAAKLRVMSQPRSPNDLDADLEILMNAEGLAKCSRRRPPASRVVGYRQQRLAHNAATFGTAKPAHHGPPASRWVVVVRPHYSRCAPANATPCLRDGAIGAPTACSARRGLWISC